ncbi:MAG: T9SS type A sorting domain-containing protein, partial [Candidatus Omnitrophica bacterium]|nr:T9SS type A sorting domain-containing protein [Candidatus Omnitrophota bacterium]
EIAANGYLIVCRDRAKFLEDYGTNVDANIIVSPTVVTGTIVYIANAYYFELKDASGVTIDKTSSLVTWNSLVNEKTDPLADGTDADNWYLTYQSSPVQGTPGHVNSTAPPATEYTISQIQDTTGTGSADSPKVGEMARTIGIVTGAFSGTYTLQDGNGAFSGIWVNDDLTVAVGDEVTVKGIVSESSGLTVITADSSGVNSSSNLVPAAEVLTTGAVSAEAWEGVLVETSGTCDSENPDAKGDYGEWSIDDGSGTIRIDDLGYLFEPTLSIEYKVVGPLTYTFGDFKIEPREATDIEVIIPPSNDLNLTFEDNSDVANWGVYDGTSGYTTVAHNATGGVGGTGAIDFGDGGYGFYIKRPVSGTVGTQYNFTVDVKTVGWDTPATYPITIAIEGLDATPISASINALADFTSIPLTGIVSNATGYIVIAGSNTSAANAGGTIMVTIDNLVFDDAADIPDTDPPTIVVAEALNDTTVVVEFSEFVDPVTAAVLTNYSMDKGIGNPTSAFVFENLVTLTLDTLASDTLYTLTVNNVQDTSSNTITANSEITFMWQAFVPGPDLFFSEYVEGNSNNRALEVYNGSDGTINLGEYTMKGTHNGDNNWDYVVFQFPAIDLAAGEVYVLANASAVADVKNVADTLITYENSTIVSFTGNDARSLFWGEHMLDVIGLPTPDPGANWPVAGGVGATSEYTLVRKSTVTMGNIDWAVSSGTDKASSEWVVMPVDDFRFLGSHPHTDFAGPEIVGVVTVGDSLVQVKFSEAVDSVAAVTYTNYFIDGSVDYPVSVKMLQKNIVVLTLDVGHYLAPNFDYHLTVNNVPDLIGNVITPNTSVLVHNIVPGDLPIDIVNTDFETTAGGWWAPAGSGSTLGILTTSTFALSDEAAYDGTKSKKMNIVNDPAKTGWFVREYNPDKPDIAIDSKVFMYVKASNPDIQIRFSFYDDGAGGDGDLLASPWIDVTAYADDWQVIGVDLATTPLVKWAGGGDGALSSTNVVSLGSIQLQCPVDVDAVLYFDKFTERPNVAPVEVTFEVSMAVQSLLGNFNISSDFVDVAGTFNGWGGELLVMNDSNGDSIYSITLGLFPTDSIEYKFRINSNWDTSEFPGGGPNRVFVVPDSNCVVYHWYNNEDRSVLGLEDLAMLPKSFALHQNYPNPFNPITTIKYDLPKEAHVKIMIYDVMGREVRTLVNARQQAGYQVIQWNAMDNSGKHVSSGYYIYVMQADNFHKTQKMILLK